MGRRKTSVAEKVSAKLAKVPGMHAMGGDPPGLYLYSHGGARSWIYRYTFNGRRRDYGLGSCIDFTLAEARELAAQARKQVRAGIDPIEARRVAKEGTKAAAAKAMTFAKCLDGYLEAHGESWRNAKHRAQWRSSVETHAGAVLGQLNVADIETGHVVRVLEPIWKTKAETATRVRGRIEAVLDWARVRGYRTGENPARWKGHLDKLLAKRSKAATVKHHPALPYREAGAFMEALRAQEGIAAAALEFTIVTAARSGETRGATWAEIDLAAKVWTVPAERMKAHVEHRVPLSPAAVAVLEEMQAKRLGDFVFPGAKEASPLSDMSLTAVLRRMKRDDVTVHGFRSTFRDWAAECTNYPREVAEAALAHTKADKVEAAYQRGDLFAKRARLMAEWARYCAKVQPQGEVVSIAKGIKR